MLSLLPDFADPLRLCALGKAYEGELPLVDFPRLQPLLMAHDGRVAFRLDFDRNSEGKAIVRVHVKGDLPVQCQRCLGTVVQPIDSESVLAVVSGPDEAERLAPEFDPLLVEDERIELRSLIEDELILAIPTVPLHDATECTVKLDAVNASMPDEEEPETARDDNPFAALAALKGDTEHQD